MSSARGGGVGDVSALTRVNDMDGEGVMGPEREGEGSDRSRACSGGGKTAEDRSRGLSMLFNNSICRSPTVMELPPSVTSSRMTGLAGDTVDELADLVLLESMMGKPAGRGKVAGVGAGDKTGSSSADLSRRIGAGEADEGPSAKLTKTSQHSQ